MYENFDWQFLLPYTKEATPESLNPVTVIHELDQLPKSIVEATGKIHSSTPLSQALCNYVLLLNAEKGDFILKIARGAYRGAQLQHEYAIGKYLIHNSQFRLLSNPINFSKEGDFYYFLQTRISGSVLSPSIDQNICIQLAKSLKEIHSSSLIYENYDVVLEYNLALAEANFHSKLIDLEEFIGIGDPSTVLSWLQSHRPSHHPLTLIHGDFRPKNTLWQDSKIVGIIDWAFSSIGDPYYDIAIIQFYLKTQQLKDTFYIEYGITDLDWGRLDYYDKLSKFLNV